MTSVEYKVVPFIGRIKASGKIEEVSAQLELLIGYHATGGWRLHSFNPINIQVQPGCLAGLFGAKAAYIQFDQVVFTRESAS